MAQNFILAFVRFKSIQYRVRDRFGAALNRPLVLNYST
jgi:hypothetical protein